MTSNTKITEAAPLSFKRKKQDDYEMYLERNSFEAIDATIPIERQHYIIREEYARRMADSEAEGRSYLGQPKFIGYNYEWPKNAEQAWFCQKSEGISLLPRFPFLHYFLDFADPFQRVAVLVEEKENPWHDERVLQEQDRLLGLSGWTVYRIFDEVANTDESTLLPGNMERCPFGEFDDNEQQQEYLDMRASMNMDRTTIDGFFAWFKQNVSERSEKRNEG